jgi:hypothetical protein
MDRTWRFVIGWVGERRVFIGHAASRRLLTGTRTTQLAIMAEWLIDTGGNTSLRLAVAAAGAVPLALGLHRQAHAPEMVPFYWAVDVLAGNHLSVRHLRIGPIIFSFFRKLSNIYFPNEVQIIEIPNIKIIPIVCVSLKDADHFVFCELHK